MDSNKLKVLTSVNYKVLNTCGRCKHSNFRPNTRWGKCSIIKYEHQKHSVSSRRLSIHKSGVCDKFEASQVEVLGGYEELLS